MDLITTSVWKELPIDHPLIFEWFTLPNYQHIDTDIEIEWGEKFNIPIEEQMRATSDMDGSFKGSTRNLTENALFVI